MRKSVISYLYDELEVGDWSEVENHCNSILEIDKECADALFVLMLAQNRIKSLSDARKKRIKCISLKQYDDVMKYASAELKEKIQSADRNITDDILRESAEKQKEKELEKKRREESQKKKEEDYEKRFQELKSSLLSFDNDVNELSRIRDRLIAYGDYKNAKELVNISKSKIESARNDAIYNEYTKVIEVSKKSKNIEYVIKQLEDIREWRDTEDIIALGKKKLLMKKRGVMVIIVSILLIASIIFVGFHYI